MTPNLFLRTQRMGRAEFFQHGPFRYRNFVLTTVDVALACVLMAVVLYREAAILPAYAEAAIASLPAVLLLLWAYTLVEHRRLRSVIGDTPMSPELAEAMTIAASALLRSLFIFSIVCVWFSLAIGGIVRAMQ